MGAVAVAVADGGGVRPIHYIIMLYYEIIKRLEEKQQGRACPSECATVNGSDGVTVWKNDGGRMQGRQDAEYSLFPFPVSVADPVQLSETAQVPQVFLSRLLYYYIWFSIPGVEISKIRFRAADGFPIIYGFPSVGLVSFFRYSLYIIYILLCLTAFCVPSFVLSVAGRGLIRLSVSVFSWVGVVWCPSVGVASCSPSVLRVSIYAGAAWCCVVSSVAGCVTGAAGSSVVVVSFFRASCSVPAGGFPSFRRAAAVFLSALILENSFYFFAFI